MNNQLHQIQNWRELASKAGWCANTLAEHCGVTLRSLERYFQKKIGKTPKKWLFEQRLLRADELIQRDFSVKETAMLLGYKQPSHLTNAFKKQWGCCPTDKSAPTRAQSP